MEATEIITLAVDPDTADRLRSADAATMRRVHIYLHQALATVPAGEVEPRPTLVDVMNATSRQAATRGYDAAAEAEMGKWLQDKL